MSTQDNETLATQVRDMLSQDSTLTIDQIATDLEAPHTDIAQVLDEWQVGEDGSLAFVGSGQGGGWTPRLEPPAEGPEIRTPEMVLDKDLEEGIITEEQRASIKEQMEQVAPPEVEPSPQRENNEDGS